MPRTKKVSQSVYEALKKEYENQIRIDPSMTTEKEVNLETLKPPCNVYPERPRDEEIFWRCDSRPPEELKGTNLTPRKDSGLTWRIGGQMDDLNGHTCVCLTKTIEGAVFFPCELDDAEETTTYLYAIKLDRGYCDSDKMQRIVHRLINPDDYNVGDTYYPYDPLEEEEHGWISPRWLYGEVVTDEVTWEEVVGCWRLERELLIQGSTNTKPGVTVTDKKKVGKKAIEEWSDTAQIIVDKWFSSIGRNHYYSYGGIVKLGASVAPPTSEQQAEQYYYEYAANALDANQTTGKLRPKLEFITRDPFTDGFEVD